jgi:hypothetical protein
MLEFSAVHQVGALGVEWLVLARHEIVPTVEAIHATRRIVETLAIRHGGEYDGWEAELDS